MKSGVTALVAAASHQHLMPANGPPDPSPDNGDTRRRPLAGLQERWERTLIGQASISAVIVTILLIGVVWNSPDAAITKTLREMLRPVAESTGLEQYWNMFAPNPPQRLEDIAVHVITAQGAQRAWTPEYGGVFDQFSWYHWHKLKENAAHSPRIRADIAHWVTDHLTTREERPVRVVMTLWIQSLPAPGVADNKPASTEILYDAVIGERP